VSKAKTFTIWASASVVAVLLVGASLAGAGVIGQEEPTTTIIAASGYTPQGDAPSQAEVESLFDAAISCMEAEGIEIASSSVTVGKIDVSTETEYTAKPSTMTLAEAGQIEADCRADFDAAALAWTDAAGPIPWDDVERAFEACTLRETGDVVDPQTAQQSNGALFGLCMETARAEVLGVGVG
jgi:uncharacterized protein with GYD domain